MRRAAWSQNHRSSSHCLAPAAMASPAHPLPFPHPSSLARPPASFGTFPGHFLWDFPGRVGADREPDPNRPGVWLTGAQIRAPHVRGSGGRGDKDGTHAREDIALVASLVWP